MFLLLVFMLTFVYVSDKIGINDTILTKYENSNAISDLAFQKNLKASRGLESGRQKQLLQ